jgi:hypothetical protein
MAMSISRKVLKLVQKALPSLRLCSSMLVLPPTEHILRGFCFERTPYKETFYLWRLVLPLYRYHSRRTLDYSERIPRGEYLTLAGERPEHSAEEIVRIISEDVPNLERIRTPSDFLDHVAWMVGNDGPHFLLDLAVTYFLLGRGADAMEILRQVPVRIDELIAYYAVASGPESPIVKRLAGVSRVAEDLSEQIKVDPAAAAQTLDEWQRKNIVAFGLAAVDAG